MTRWKYTKNISRWWGWGGPLCVKLPLFSIVCQIYSYKNMSHPLLSKCFVDTKQEVSCDSNELGCIVFQIQHQKCPENIFKSEIELDSKFMLEIKSNYFPGQDKTLIHFMILYYIPWVNLIHNMLWLTSCLIRSGNSLPDFQPRLLWKSFQWKHYKLDQCQTAIFTFTAMKVNIGCYTTSRVVCRGCKRLKWHLKNSYFAAVYKFGSHDHLVKDKSRGLVKMRLTWKFHMLPHELLILMISWPWAYP